MTCALAIVALAGWLQWFSVSMGVTPKAYTENADVSAAAQGPNTQLDLQILHPDIRWSGSVTSSQQELSPQEPSHLDLYVLPQIPTLREIRTVQPEPVATVAAVQLYDSGVQLTEAEAISVLQAAGWPTELIPQALAVSWCESKWSPGASGDSGRSRGWFQLNVATWFPYAGEDPALWADPLVNARVAWATYNYDLSRGQRAWQQWSCRTAVY